MKKILFKQIVLSLTIIAGFMFVLSLGIIFHVQSKIAINDLEEMVEQVEVEYTNSKLVTEEKIKLFQDDYLNRAYAIDFILNQDSKNNYNITMLKKIKKLMEVESINIINHAGQIVFSSEKESVGLNLKDYQEAAPFWELIDSEDSNANVVHMNASKIVGKGSQIFIGVRSTSEEYSVVQIGVDPSTLENLLVSDSIASIVNKAPTVYDKAVFVVDKDSGEIEGSTKNNELGLNFQNVNTKEEFIAALKKGEGGRLVRINGSLKLLNTKEIDNKIIGAYVQADTIFDTIELQVFALLCAVLFIIICVWMILKYSIKKYILKDLFSIEANIKNLMYGNYDISFETQYNTEFRKICTILNYWKDSYKSKSERMTRIINSIDRHVAVFECLYSINQNFFSDNMQYILELDDDVWNEIKNTSKGFENYLNSLISSENTEDKIIKLNNKSVSIVTFRTQDEFYGMILDKTEDEIRKKRMEEELHNIQEESEKDSLTKLTNRAGLEKYIRKSLENDPGKGIMIIFDLDNFKLVNDQQGHPEGDKVLQKFADCLKSCFRKDDVVARMGGDEFAVFIYANLSEQEISDKLEYLLQIIRSELYEYYNNYEVSTSIGVAYVDNRTNSYEDLYKCADVALYMAKRFGKDRFYINIENIRCMKNQCTRCTKDCQKRKLLGL